MGSRLDGCGFLGLHVRVGTVSLQGVPLLQRRLFRTFGRRRSLDAGQERRVKINQIRRTGFDAVSHDVGRMNDGDLLAVLLLDRRILNRRQLIERLIRELGRRPCLDRRRHGFGRRNGHSRRSGGFGCGR